MKQQELRLTATLNHLDQVNAFVQAALDEAGCPPRAAMQLMIAVEELFVNIAHYAYAPGTGDAVIRVLHNEDEGTFTVVFADWGTPFDPLSQLQPDITLSADERPIGGLGIYMVKKSMDAFTYNRCDGQNIVSITKKTVK